MKQQISGPVGIGIAVVIVGLICFFLYNTFLKGPGTLTPEDMRKNMAKGMQQQQEAYKNRGPRPPGGGPGSAPGGPPPGGSGGMMQGR